MSRQLRRPSEPADAKSATPDLAEVAARLRALADICNPPDAATSHREEACAEAVSGPEIAGRVRSYLAARRRRDSVLGPGWFADPAWDMLLDLLACRLEGVNITVSSACIAAAVPPTTALRWLKSLVDAGVLLRVEDPADGRRVYVTLDSEIAARLGDWVAASLVPARSAD